ncbi:DNA polymerase epsilon subunit 2, partial [Galemys pyrenaicus]
EAIKYLTEALQSVSEIELEDALEKVIDAVEKQPLSSNMIERSVVEAAVQECSQSVDETILSMTNHPAPSLFGTPRDKAELFRERYTILHQRTHRHELFTPPVIGSHPDESGNKFQLKTVETLMGSTTKIGDVIILGMITQLKEGKFFLEDPTGTVQLDLSWFEDQIFHVNAFGFPPTEPSSTTRAYYGNTNFFGGPSNTSVKSSLKLKQLEDENKDAMFVFISDVWLDRVEVLEKFHTMFSGSSRFVFVPGPEDPGFGSILPRIQYCTQEIIVFREDLVNKMCRNCVRFPSRNWDIPNHFVKTILSQGHLTPLPLYVCPVYWAYDYALRVYPVPDLLVIADKYDPFSLTNTECLCIN